MSGLSWKSGLIYYEYEYSPDVELEYIYAQPHVGVRGLGAAAEGQDAGRKAPLL